MALFTGTNFHKTFAIIIKFHLKLLCNNVTMYVLYVSPIFREYITFLRRKIPMELIIPEHYDPRLDIRETQDAIKYIRDTFQKEMGREMHLERISAPLFVEKEQRFKRQLKRRRTPCVF